MSIDFKIHRPWIIGYGPYSTRSKAYKPLIRSGLNLMIWTDKDTKAGCVFPIVISSDLRMGQHRDDDHQEDAPHFI